MRIQFFVNLKSGVSYHRLINPMEFMTFDEGDSAEMLFTTEDEHLVQDLKEGDILLYNKFLTMTSDRVELVKKRGVKIVVDIDDSWDLPFDHPFYKQWTDMGNTKRVIDNIKVADLVICATERLQEKVRQLNKNTIVIPNAFPFGHDLYTPMKEEGREKIGFIYVAGATHLKDVKLLEGKFENIGGETFIRKNAEFIIAGYEPTKVSMYHTKKDLELKNNNFDMKKITGDWDRMATIFSKTNSHKVLNSTNLDEYINFYDQADVAIIPLRKTEWNSFKSPLKIIEAGVKKLPVICSNVAPYSDAVAFKNEGVNMVNNNSEWIEHIKYYIRNPKAIQEHGEKLFEWVSDEFDLFKWNEVRKQAFKHLTSK